MDLQQTFIFQFQVVLTYSVPNNLLQNKLTQKAYKKKEKYLEQRVIIH